MLRYSICLALALSLGVSAPAYARWGMCHERGAMAAQLDTNQDGQVSVAELQAGRSARFQQADLNGDGSLDLSELQNQRDTRRAQRHAARYQELDTDGNGLITVAEFQNGHPVAMAGTSATLFGLADTNADNLLSQAEFNVLASPQGRQWKRFARLDTDGDGKVSADECIQARPMRGPGMRHRGPGHGPRPRR